MEYLEFIESKKKVIKESGISINELNLNPLLKDFQKFIVTKALNNGKFAIFADCGLGKTFMQLEWAYQALKMNRKFIGFELKESYFNLACRNMDRAINENKQLTLLDLIA